MSDHEGAARVAVISRYDVPTLKQRDLSAILERALRDWICKRPGFESGTVHSSLDEHRLVVYSVWAHQDEAMNFLQCEEGRALSSSIASSGAIVRHSHIYSIGETVTARA